MYEVVQDRSVLDQIDMLPTAALPHYAEALGVLELAPHSGRPYNAAKPEGPMRQLVFGAAAEGTITYLLLEDQRQVHVLLVQWLG